MKGDRFRVPIDEPYLRSVGLAMICFARLEWSAVWCCEKIQPDYIATIKEEKKTAGGIAKDLVRLAAAHGDPAVVKSLGLAAAEFKRLVKERNALLHADPATAPNGDQRLFRDGKEWTIGRVDDLADEFVATDDALNHHVHHVL